MMARIEFSVLVLLTRVFLDFAVKTWSKVTRWWMTSQSCRDGVRAQILNQRTEGEHKTRTRERIFLVGSSQNVFWGKMSQVYVYTSRSKKFATSSEVFGDFSEIKNSDDLCYNKATRNCEITVDR